MKKLILGICNGFQTLTKAGLLPSVNKNHQEATLTFNDSNKFEDRWVYLKVCSNKSVFIKDTDIPTLYLPIAHGEGKFITKDKTVLNEITTNHQVVFKYVNERGEEAGYPWNPAGAIQNIAGICDPTGQILGMMPHPEKTRRTSATSALDTQRTQGMGRRFFHFQKCSSIRENEFLNKRRYDIMQKIVTVNKENTSAVDLAKCRAILSKYNNATPCRPHPYLTANAGCVWIFTQKHSGRNNSRDTHPPE